MLQYMKLVVDNEDEIYDFTLSESVDILSFVNILDQRPLLNCWLEDYVTKVWIRVPRIEVLRMLLKEFPVSTIFRLRFQANSKYPNSSSHVTTPIGDLVVIQQESTDMFTTFPSCRVTFNNCSM
jgi:hypothetical protein